MKTSHLLIVLALAVVAFLFLRRPAQASTGGGAAVDPTTLLLASLLGPPRTPQPTSTLPVVQPPARAAPMVPFTVITGGVSPTAPARSSAPPAPPAPLPAVPPKILSDLTPTQLITVRSELQSAGIWNGDWDTGLSTIENDPGDAWLRALND